MFLVGISVTDKYDYAFIFRVLYSQWNAKKKNAEIINKMSKPKGNVEMKLIREFVNSIQ